MIRRISVYGGPGSGKSTLSSRLYFELKKRHYDVEVVAEYVKGWAHEGRQPTSYDQLYLFAKQVKAEDTLLRAVRYVITDSPVLMSTAYAQMLGFPAVKDLIAVAQQFDRDFPSLNLFIKRTVPYVTKGRFQTEMEAHEFDSFLLDFLGKHLPGDFFQVEVEDFPEILALVGNHLG